MGNAVTLDTFTIPQKYQYKGSPDLSIIRTSVLSYSLDPLDQKFQCIMQDIPGFCIFFNLYPT